ncbi:unnamed protein product, partial [Polarella glacialis]
MAEAPAELAGVYSWNEEGLSDAWSCQLTLFDESQKLPNSEMRQQEDLNDDFTAMAVFRHVDFCDMEEASCCFGRWRPERLEDGLVITFSSWSLGPDLPPLVPREPGSLPLDDVEAPARMRILTDNFEEAPGARRALRLKVEEWEGSCDNVFLHTKEVFKQ